MQPKGRTGHRQTTGSPRSTGRARAGHRKGTGRPQAGPRQAIGCPQARHRQGTGSPHRQPTGRAQASMVSCDAHVCFAQNATRPGCNVSPTCRAGTTFHVQLSAKQLGQFYKLPFGSGGKMTKKARKGKGRARQLCARQSSAQEEETFKLSHAALLAVVITCAEEQCGNLVWKQAAEAVASGTCIGPSSNDNLLTGMQMRRQLLCAPSSRSSARAPSSCGNLASACMLAYR